MRQTGTDKGKIYGILTSVGDYSRMKAANLPTWRNDQEYMKACLTNGLQLDPDNICTVGDQGIVLSTEFASTLKSFSEMLSEEDSLIFYFSGHGRKSELALSDVTVKLDSVLRFLNSFPCKSKLIILDCCCSGEFSIEGPRQMSMEDTIRSFAGSGIAIMASSAGDEASRLGIGKKYSLYTEFVGKAMLSRRKIRKGYLSLDDLNSEVMEMMDAWNREHPHKSQHPVFRSSLGGTIFFKAAGYIPYVQQDIYVETEQYTIYSASSLSTAQHRRMAVFVIFDEEDCFEKLPIITHEIAGRMKNKGIFADEAEERRFKDTPADTIWCYFGKDESDLIQHRYYAYTIWAASEEQKSIYYRKDSHSEERDGICISSNSSYQMLKKLQTPSMSRDVFIAENKKLLAEIVSMAESFIFDLQSVVNGTGDKKDIQSRYKDWILEVRRKYILLTDLEEAPDDLSEWANQIYDLAGWVLDISFLLEGNMGDTELWMIQNSIRRYKESLEHLKALEESTFGHESP